MAMSAASPDGAVRAGPGTVVTLIPGTWAGKAAWIRADSPLNRALTTAGCQVVPFEWSHRNSHRARARAAQRLAEQLHGQINESPAARQWIVAHSHGGNIALHAVRHLRGSGAGAPRVSTVTLATPFIHARRRALSGKSVLVLAVFSAGVVGWAWTLLAGHPHWRDWPVLGFGALVAGDALVCIGGACMHPGFRWRGSLRWLKRRVNANPENWPFDVIGAVLRGKFIRPGYQSQLISDVHSPTVEPEDVFLVRAAGDEASTSLAAGQFLGWLSALPNPLLTKPLTNRWFWTVIIFPLQALVAAALVNRRVIPAERVVVYVSVLAGLAAAAGGLVATLAVAVMLAAALPFGLDGPFLSIFASCSAEAAPPGQATILQLEPFPVRVLAHSGLYGSEPVISTIVTLICGSPQRNG